MTTKPVSTNQPVAIPATDALHDAIYAIVVRVTNDQPTSHVIADDIIDLLASQPSAQPSDTPDYWLGTENADGDLLPTDAEIVAAFGKEFGSDTDCVQKYRMIQKHVIDGIKNIAQIFREGEK